MALVGYGAEVVMANRAPLRASFVTRLIVPGVMFLAIALVYVLGPRYGATGAAIAYGLPVAALYFVFVRVGRKKFGVMGEKSKSHVSSSLTDIDADEFSV